MFKISTDALQKSEVTYGSLDFHCSVTGINGFLRMVDQISCSASFNSGIFLVSTAAYGVTPAFPPNVIIQWIEI